MNDKQVPPAVSREIKRKAYRKPTIKPLGEMRRVTRKSGPVPDNSPANPTRP